MNSLHERAEDYSFRDLQEFIASQTFVRGEERNLCEDLFAAFLSSDSSIMNVYSPRGMGKTLFVKTELIKHNKKFAYFPYFKKREIPRVLPAEKIIVIDDIHYIQDDIRENERDRKELLSLIEKAILESKKGKKIIFISEDIFLPNYFESQSFKEIFSSIIQQQYKTDVRKTAQILGCKDNDLLNFFQKYNPTPRGITSFLKNVAKDWQHVCELSFQTENWEKFPKKPRKEKGISKRPSNFSSKDWKKLSLFEKKAVWNEIRRKKKEEFKKDKEEFLICIETRNYKNKHIIEFVENVFSKYLYLDQGYYLHLKEIVSQPKLLKPIF